MDPQRKHLYFQVVSYNPNLVTNPSVRAQILENYQRGDMLTQASMCTVLTVMSYFGVRSYIFPQSRPLYFGCALALSGALLYPI